MSISCMSLRSLPDLSANIAKASARNSGPARRVGPTMLGVWLHDLESFEALSQDADARRIFLRMAALSHAGRTRNVLAELADDSELDDDMKGHLRELAQDESFLVAVEEYLQRTQRVH